MVILLVTLDKIISCDPVSDSWKTLCEQALSLIQGELIVVTDVTDGKKVISVTESLPTTIRQRLVEHPFHQDSKVSPILQAVDMLAYLHRQRFSPNRIFEGTGGRRLLNEFTFLVKMKQGVEPKGPTPA